MIFGLKRNIYFSQLKERNIDFDFPFNLGYNEHYKFQSLYKGSKL